MKMCVREVVKLSRTGGTKVVFLVDTLLGMGGNGVWLAVRSHRCWGGNPNVVEHEQSGLRVASEDAETAAARILQLLRAPSLRRRMGNNGRKVARAFTVDVLAGRVAGLYDELIANRNNLANGRTG